MRSGFTTMPDDGDQSGLPFVVGPGEAGRLITQAGLLTFFKPTKDRGAMTFDANHGNGSFHCDTCPEAVATGESDFKLALIEARRKGWKTYRGPDKQWAHSCPSCAEDYVKERKKNG